MTKRKFYGNQYTLVEELFYDYDDMVEDVRALADELGRPPSTRDAVRDDRLPSIKKIYGILGPKGWHDILSDAGVGQTQVEEYGPEERPKILEDIRRVFDQTDADYLTIREYEKYGSYNKSVVKRLFDTWAKACEAANILPGMKHGRQCKGPNGELLESRLELNVANALDKRDLEYIPHKPIPNTRWRCDFYVPELSLWIEADGYVGEQRPNRSSLEEKLRHYDRMNMEYAVVTGPKDLEEKVFQRS